MSPEPGQVLRRTYLHPFLCISTFVPREAGEEAGLYLLVDLHLGSGSLSAGNSCCLPEGMRALNGNSERYNALKAHTDTYTGQVPRQKFLPGVELSGLDLDLQPLVQLVAGHGHVQDV